METYPISDHDTSESATFGEAASRVMPGGVASVNRLLTRTLYFSSAKGASVTDLDGHTYIDYNCAFGATILGHSDPAVTARVAEAACRIGLIGLGGTDLEVELAERLVQLIPSAEQVAFCNSGSEATFNALRLARAATGRSLIVKFQGGYHGWHDSVAMNVATPAERLGQRDPLSEGILPAQLDATLIGTFNDIDSLEQLFAAHGPRIAAVIIEPILHNVGAVPATVEFLTAAKRLCAAHGSVLVFDEVITAFRHALGGYQEITGVTPDLTTVGKAIANGYPLAALVGRESLMQHFRQRPIGNVYHGGTYNGHPVMAAAALATIDRLSEPDAYDYLFGLGQRYREDLAVLVSRHGLAAQPAGYGSVWLLEWFVGDKHSYDDLLANRTEEDVAFRTALLERGYISSTVPLKRYNITLAHTDEHRAATMAAIDDVLSTLLRH